MAQWQRGLFSSHLYHRKTLGINSEITRLLWIYLQVKWVLWLAPCNCLTAFPILFPLHSITESNAGIQHYPPRLKEHQQPSQRQVDSSEAKAEHWCIPEGKKCAGNWVPRLETVILRCVTSSCRCWAEWPEQLSSIMVRAKGWRETKRVTRTRCCSASSWKIICLFI